MKYIDFYNKLKDNIKDVKYKEVLLPSQKSIYWDFIDPIGYASSSIFGMYVLFDELSGDITALKLKVINHLPLVEKIERERLFMECPVFHIVADDEQSCNIEDVTILCTSF